jgi:hypothetical protein
MRQGVDASHKFARSAAERKAEVNVLA